MVCLLFLWGQSCMVVAVPEFWRLIFFWQHPASDNVSLYIVWLKKLWSGDDCIPHFSSSYDNMDQDKDESHQQLTLKKNVYKRFGNLSYLFHLSQQFLWHQYIDNIQYTHQLLLAKIISIFHMKNVQSSAERSHGLNVLWIL